MFFLVLLVVFCLCAVYLGFKWKLKRQRLVELASLTPMLKGGLPVIGHGWAVHEKNSEDLWNKIKIIMNETTAAGGVLGLWLGPSLQYIITDPEDAVTVMNKCLEKNRYIYDMGKTFFGDSLVACDVSRWKRNRKLLNPSFSQHKLHQFEFVFDLQAKKFVKSLEQLAGKGVTSVWREVSDISLNTVCITVFGISEFNESLVSEVYKGAVSKIFTVLIERFTKLILHPDILFKFSRLKKTHDALVEIVCRQSYKFIEQRKKERAADKDDTKTSLPVAQRFESFLDILLNLANEHVFEDHKIKDEINSIIIAGYDTLATAILYTLMLIGSYPEVQRKMYEEIILVVGPKDDITKYHNLPYVDAVFKESLRLYPPAPIISRYCDEEIQLKNYKLPAGCHCSIGIWNIQRLPIWGADAEQFRPERWLEPGSLPKNAGAFCAFSFGKRNCIGKLYSTVFTKTLLTYVVRRFRISANITDLKFKMEVMLKPACEDRLTLELR